MKSKIITLSILGFIICTAFNKISNDYRDSYIGTYFCHSSYTVLVNTGQGGTQQTHTDTLSISVAKAAKDSVLAIKIGTNTHLFKLKNNILYAHPKGEHRIGRFIDADSILVSIEGGHFASFIYTGKKK
ncbi:MAG: hypothetical protein ACYDCN_13445 [Bacteroidia bacterium]